MEAEQWAPADKQLPCKSSRSQLTTPDNLLGSARDKLFPAPMVSTVLIVHPKGY